MLYCGAAEEGVSMKNLYNATDYLNRVALKAVGAPLAVLLLRLTAAFEDQTGEKAEIELLHGQESDGPRSYDFKIRITTDEIPLANIRSKTTDQDARNLLGTMAAIVAGPIYAEYREHSGHEQLARNVQTQLSYCEGRIVARLLEKLLEAQGDSIRCVVTSLARAEGVTRSVALSALSKLEAAGLIHTMNMGMKGLLVALRKREALVALQQGLVAAYSS